MTRKKAAAAAAVKATRSKSLKTYQAVPFRDFTTDEHETWNLMFNTQAKKRDRQIWSAFTQGVQTLGWEGHPGVPHIDEVNRRLEKTSGFKGVPVVGLEEDESFYAMLAEGKFPIGNFIRDRQDLSYTPAPDVFHDLYGHMPFFVHRDYAKFCRELGRNAMKVASKPEGLKQWARLFWFTIEFGLIKTAQGNRIFGAGIASSIGECDYALSDKPEIIPFSVEAIRNQDFKIDEFQRKLFILDTPEQLYGCLGEFDRAVMRSLA